jgi:competence protein ComEC
MTGLSRFPDPVAIGLAVLVGVLLPGQPSRRALAFAALAGVAWGGALRTQSAAHCANRLPADDTTFSLRVVDPGPGTGRVRPLGLGCHGIVTARWPRADSVVAGVTVRVTARWESRRAPLGRPDGTLIIGGRSAARGAPGLIARSRTAVRDAIAARFGGHAPIVAALVMGRRSGLDPQLRRDFAAAGMVHLLVISGFHVGLLAGWVILVLGATGLPPRWGMRLGVLIALGYVAWLGWPAPATRAAVLMAVVVLGRWYQRHWRPDGTLGASALVVLLVDPWAITRIGAWLSFAALAGVVVATRWVRIAWPVPRAWRDMLAASIGATVATAPLAAAVFGQVALVGVLLNLVAMPLAGLAVPAIGLALAAHAMVPPLAGAYAAMAAWLLDRLAVLGSWGSSLPGAGVAGADGFAAALPWCGVALLLLAAIHGRATPREALRRTAWGTAAAAWLLLLIPTGGMAVGRPDGQLAITFLAVGQGDAAAIRTPGGHWLVVDVGPADARWDAGERVVVPFLRRAGARRVELLVLSHAHRDHAGGVRSLLAALPVGAVLDPGEPFDDSDYRQTLDAIGRRGVDWQVGVAGSEWSLDGVTFRVVHPSPHWARRGFDLNDDSIVLEVRFGAFSALLAGDAGVHAESAFVGRVGRVDLLKVGHHGSRTATGTLLLDRLRPEAAVVSLGRNRYGHPAPETLARLAAAGVATWRTDRDGPVTLTTDGRTFTVRGERTHATFDAADP